MNAAREIKVIDNRPRPLPEHNYQTPAPMTEGEARFGAGQTPASPTVPLGEAGPNSSDADAVGALASEGTPEVLVDVPDDSPSYQDAYEWRVRGAESARVLGHEAGNETSGQPPAMQADTSPRWSAVDDDTSDLLSLVADEGPFPVDEWPFFLDVLQKVAEEHDGLIDQNLTRPMLRGQIRPARTGSFFHRAARMGLIRADGWNESDDREQRNGGKPIRLWRWLNTRGGESHA